MNITDIDDKIIKRARQNYLYDKYVADNQRSLEQLLSDQKTMFEHFNHTIQKNTDPDKKIMLLNSHRQMNEAIYVLENAVKSNDCEKIDAAKEYFLKQVRDPLSDWLDTIEGSSVTENSIFEALPRYWEEEFHKDMAALNV